MAYLALYREWRPKRFLDIVGQEHVTRTLVNALQQKKIAHAYLFSGPRGTGKTTAAKILAKAVNCEHPVGVEPCNQCASCRAIDRSSGMDVYEIDAASNRGIDEIRDLRENVKLSAGTGKHKIYIIDEVHMLTTEAFNALLKTLEEPPPQVIFILATTEAQKIPLTILSRVQRFEFHRISIDDIHARLTEVCGALERKVDSQALTVIAQKSEGGLRDALSILDQCLLQDDPIGVREVYAVLGMVGEEFSAQLVDALLLSDYGKSLAILSEGVQQGRDPRQIIKELLEYLRQMLLSLTTGSSPLVEPHTQAKLLKQCEHLDTSRLLSWISILLQGEGQLKFASNARLAAELLLVKAIHDSIPTVVNGQEEIMKRLAALEQQVMLSSGPKINSSLVSRPVSASKDNKTQAGLKAEKRIDSAINVEQVTKDHKANLSIATIQEHWNEVLDEVKKLKKSTQAFLLEGKPMQLEDNILTILFREGCSFHKDKVNQVENRQTIEGVLKKLFGVPLILKNLMVNEYQIQETAEDQDADKQEEKTLVDKTKDMFGDDLVVVRD